jgi:hypothetical protein
MLAHSSGSVVSTQKISWGRCRRGLGICETNRAEEDVKDPSATNEPWRPVKDEEE